MDFWEDSLQPDNNNQKHKKSPYGFDVNSNRGVVIAVLAVVCLLVIVALCWKAPIAQESAGFSLQSCTFEGNGYSYRYSFAQNGAFPQSCGVLMVDGQGTVLAAEAADDVDTEGAQTVFSGFLEAAADAQPLGWVILDGQFLVESTGETTEGSQKEAPEDAPRETLPASNSADIHVTQYANSNGTTRVVFETTLDGLNPNMMYMGGFMLSPENEILESAGNSQTVFGLSEFTLTAQVDIADAKPGDRYQCVFFYYSMDGAFYYISNAQLFDIEATAALPTPPAATQAVILPDNTPTPTPSPTVAPTQTPVATREPAVTAVPLAEEPQAEQFRLYPAQLRYYYNQLTTHEKQLFSLLYDGISELKDTIEVSGYGFTESEMSRVRDVLLCDCPELIQLDIEAGMSHYINDRTGQIIRVLPTYGISGTQTFTDSYNGMIEKLKEISKRSDFGTTEYSREMSIYRYLIDNCYYDMDLPRCAYPDGLFLHGYAKCSGYARAFALACRYYGISCTTVIGETMETETMEYIGHMWCYVMIDGNWYTCDPTWDDPILDSNSQPNELYSQILKYFNLTDEGMNIGRVISFEMQLRWTLPVCNQTEADFFVRSMPQAIVQGNWQTFLQNRLDEVAQNGEDAIALRFESRSDYENALGTMEGVIDKWRKANSFGIRYSYVYHMQAKLIVIYNISISR